MCYEALLDGRAHERTLSRLFRGELSAAAKNGLAAAAIVALVVAYRGIDLPIVAGVTVGAFVLGVVLHQVLLVVGVFAVRLGHTRGSTGPKQ